MEFHTFESDPQASYAQFGLSFARALSGGDTAAYAMLSQGLKSSLSSADFFQHYRDMIGAESGHPTYLEIITTMTEWPEKQPNDIGWVYVAIAGDHFSEGIACVVEVGKDGPCIRNVEWGRP